MNSTKSQNPLNNFFRREFFIDVSRAEPFAVQAGNGREIPLAILSKEEILKLQEHASRQFRRNFYKESDNVDEHRATLYFLNSWLDSRTTMKSTADRAARRRSASRGVLNKKTSRTG